MDTEVTFKDFYTNMLFTQYPNCVIFMIIAWMYFLYTRIEVIVDFCWCLNYYIIGVVQFNHYSDKANYHPWIQLGLLSMWFCRLGGFIFFSRVLKGFRDGRYTAFVESLEGKPYQHAREGLYFFFSFQIQAVFVVPSASTLYWVFRNNENKNYEMPSQTFILGSLLSFVGIVGEWIADRQIQNYKDKKADIKELQKQAEEQKVILKKNFY